MTLILENQWKTYFSFNAFNVANKTSITFEPKPPKNSAHYQKQPLSTIKDTSLSFFA